MNIAVILAGGVGSRSGLNKPKQFLKIAGKTVLEHTVDMFQKHEAIDEIFIVIHPSYMHDAEDMVIRNGWQKVKKILNGGSERYESSLAAINACPDNDENTNVIFHDAVRPLVSDRIIDDVVKALDKYSAVDVAVPAVDTIIAIDKDNEIIDYIPDRRYLNRGQTPQGFKLEVIKKAYDKALSSSDFSVTDDCGIVRKHCPEVPIHIVMGEERNIKLTYPEDIYLLDKLFQLKSSILRRNIDLKQLNNKVIIIFGGNSGIGEDMGAIASRLGAKVYSFSRSLNGIDITDKKLVIQALENVFLHEQTIDYVVNTAAILNKQPILHLSDSEISKMIDINYIGVINVTLAAFPYLKKSKGQILQFTSSSYTRGRAYYSLYSSTKAAVVNFVQAIAEEWDKDGIRINCINPQRTKTPMRIKNFGIEPDSTLLSSEYVAKIALKTLLSNCSGEVIDVKIE